MPAGGLALFGLGTVGVVGWIIGLLIAAWFMKTGAKLAGIENPTIGQSIIAIIGGGILAAIVAIVLFFLPVINLIAALIAYIWVIKVVFNTGWVRAFLAWIFAIIIQVVVAVVISLVFSGLLAAL